MILLDSSVWVEYFAAGKLGAKYEKYVEQASEENTITPTIIVYEVYKKVSREKGEELALEVYGQLARTKIVPLSEELAISAADVSQKLGLGMADSIIYATARSEQARLVTGDEHFKGLEDVEFIGD
jgi:predicted nucleic acid-binding protein